MSTQKHPPAPVRHRPQHLHEIEFFERFTAPRGEILDARQSILDAQQTTLIRERLLDPRLQRIVAAAANGWVVERLRG